MRLGVLLIVASIMLVVGTVVALVWWKLADRIFPGASRSSGQQIKLGRDGKATPQGPPPTVIRGYGDPPPKT